MDASSVIRDTRDEVRDIVAEPDDVTYQHRVSDFLAARKQQFHRIAQSLCRANSVRSTQYLEEVQSIVAETCWQMIESSREDIDYLDRMRSWEAILTYNARPKVRSHLDHATSPASGMVSAQRRYRELARTRSELTAARGVTPSVKETVEATNERLSSTRKDPVRQGMRVTEADEAFARGSTPLDENLDAELHHVDFAENYILHPAEGPGLITNVIALAGARDAMCARVAQMWMGEAYASGGPPPGTDTVAWIASELGITREQTQRHIKRVRTLAIEYLSRMGITDSDVRGTARKAS